MGEQGPGARADPGGRQCQPQGKGGRSPLIDASDKGGRSPLIDASDKGFEEVLGLLLEAGANVNQVGSDGWSALAAASANFRAEAVKVLLAHKADASLVDKSGQSALHEVRSRYGAEKVDARAEMAKLLLAAPRRATSISPTLRAARLSIGLPNASK